MKLIVGLGNPGKKYENNRHNAGFRAVELLTRKPEFSILNFQFSNKFKSELAIEKNVIFVKPMTFMNESGLAVSLIMNFYKIKPEDLYVIHDDLDLRLGEYKIQFGIGPKVHNGVNSIEEKLGSKDFWRVRVGIDNRSQNSEVGIQKSEFRMAGEEYVLEDFLPEEMAIFNTTGEKIVEDLRKILK